MGQQLAQLGCKKFGELGSAPAAEPMRWLEKCLTSKGVPLIEQVTPDTVADSSSAMANLLSPGIDCLALHTPATQPGELSTPTFVKVDPFY